MTSKIMYLNCVGVPAYDQTFAAVAAAYRARGVDVTVASLDPQVGAMDHLEYRVYETLVARDVMLAARQAAREGYDALALGCFYDPALDEARQAARGMPVIGPCQAAIETALRLANRYSVIIGRRTWQEQMHRTIRRYGFDGQLASFRSLGLGVTEMVARREETERRIVEQARRAVDEDQAEAIVLGCTLEVGFYQTVQDIVGVPVIDPAIAALKCAEHAAELRRLCHWQTSQRWSLQPPPDDELKRFGLLQAPYRFGARIEVPPG
ncbi:aspartate/glutamate racemase family protein [Pelomonas sp. KK5]|uniref:aspartate/glutamate racemase family protein n=1 Tax=Pelomonas sp. KK5 TaxID=1855730 RepID=UPI00097C9605|nr:aspartate/glutamate racemase family protein [Pelomonas sp. KK5]